MTGIAIRYAQYLSRMRVRQRAMSYNAVVAGDGKKRRRVRLRPRDLYRLVAPYVGVRFFDQSRAGIPLTLFLVLFAVVLLRATVADGVVVAAGVLSVILGLVLLLEGIQHGLMPYSE